MTVYILRRLAMLIPVLLVVAIVVFALVHLTPGDPAVVILGADADVAQIEGLRDQLGLNDPVHIQFFHWFGNVLRPDFGDSIFFNMSVGEALLQRAQPTVLLTVYALVIQVSLGIIAGVLAAVHSNTWLDRLLMMAAITGAAVPNFFFGILLILLFAVGFGWLPSGGYASITDDPVRHLQSMILPAIALGTTTAGLLARLVRTSMLDVLREDYVRTAFAKGLENRTVIVRHALRNALIPAITIVGGSIGALLGGAVVTETVFTIPGMGRLVVQSIARRDYPVIQGAIIVIAAVYVLVNLLVDILYLFIDPRIRYGDE